MSSFLFSGGRFLDPLRGELMDGIEVLIEGERVKEVADRPIKSAAATRVELAGRTLMPGLIDAHLHVFLNEVNIGALDAVPLTLLAINGAIALKRSEEHTSELQSLTNLVCRLLLEKKKKATTHTV